MSDLNEYYPKKKNNHLLLNNFSEYDIDIQMNDNLNFGQNTEIAESKSFINITNAHDSSINSNSLNSIDDNSSYLRYKKELKSIDEYFVLYNIKSMGDFTSNLPHSLSSLVNFLNEIINLKEKDNGLKKKLMEAISKLEYDKNNLDRTINRLNGSNTEMSNKIIILEEKNRKLSQKLSEKELSFNTEKIELEKQKNKYEQRCMQYQHELKKKETEYEKLRKVNFKENEKKNAELYTAKSNIELQYYYTKSSKELFKSNFVDEFNKLYEMKFKNIILENEKLRNFIVLINKEARSYVDTCKSYFFSAYKSIFGYDLDTKENNDYDAIIFPDNFILISAIEDSPLDELIEAVRMNFSKIKEFTKKNFEFKLMLTNEDKAAHSSKNNNPFSQNNKLGTEIKSQDAIKTQDNSDYIKITFEENKFLNNVYKDVNLELLSFTQCLLNERQDDELLRDIISRYQEVEDTKIVNDLTLFKDSCERKLWEINEEIINKYKVNLKNSDEDDNGFKNKILDIKRDIENYQNIVNNITSFYEECLKRKGSLINNYQITKFE